MSSRSLQEVFSFYFQVSMPAKRMYRFQRLPFLLFKLMVKLLYDDKHFAIMTHWVKANAEKTCCTTCVLSTNLHILAVEFDCQICWRDTFYLLRNPTRNIGKTRVLSQLNYRCLPSLNHDSSHTRSRLICPCRGLYYIKI